MDGKKMHKFDSHHFFTALGHCMPLDHWLSKEAGMELDALNNDANMVEEKREMGSDDTGKMMIHYKSAPTKWDFGDLKTSEAGYIEYNRGHFISPHRDKLRNVTEPNQSIRLMCFLNHTHPEENCFVYDGQITQFEPCRWYMVNTQRMHYGFSFVDGVKHLGITLKLTDDAYEATTKWILDHTNGVHSKGHHQTGEGRMSVYKPF